jgi:hypothetical protein
MDCVASSSSLSNAIETCSELLNSSLTQIQRFNIIEGTNPPSVIDVSNGKITYANQVVTTDNDNVIQVTIDAYQKAEVYAHIADIVPENTTGSATAHVNSSGKIERFNIYSGTHISVGSVYTPGIAISLPDEIVVTVDACPKEQVGNFVNTLPPQNIRYAPTCVFFVRTLTAQVRQHLKSRVGQVV